MFQIAILVFVIWSALAPEGFALEWWEEGNEDYQRGTPTSSLKDTKKSFLEDMDRSFQKSDVPPSPPSSSKSSESKSKNSVQIPDSTIPTCATWREPAWLMDRKLAGEFAGVGGPVPSREDAEARARKDVVKQIEVSITGTGSFSAAETAGEDMKWSVESSVVERVDLSITGLEIKEVIPNPCTNEYYALATLNRGSAINSWRHTLKELEGKTNELERQIASQAGQGQAFQALLVFDRLLAVQETGSQIARRLAYIANDPDAGGLWTGRVAQTQYQQETLLGSLRLRKLSGDRQRAIESAQLPNPLIVQLVAGEKPVPGVPLSVSISQGTVTAPATVETDAMGQARVPVRYDYDKETDAPARIMATVALGQVSHDYPKSLKERVVARAPQVTTHFEILAPVFHLIGRVNTFAARTEELRQEADERLRRHDPLHALLALHNLETIQESARQTMKRIIQLYPEGNPNLPQIGEPAHTRQEIEAHLRSFRYEISGQQQRAIQGPDLPEPLVVRVLARDVPVPGIPVQFSVEQGRLNLRADSVTDANGEARVRISHVKGMEEAAIVAARIHLEQFSDTIPPGFGKQLRERSEQLLARFFVLQPVYHLTADMVHLANQAEVLKAEIASYRKNGAVFDAMARLFRLAEVQDAWNLVRAKLIREQIDPTPSMNPPGDPEKSQRELDALIAAIFLKKGSGDGQEATLNEPLPNPLETYAVARLPENEIPIPSVPIYFAFEEGTGRVDGRLQTGMKGQVQAVVHKVDPGEGEFRVVAGFDVEHIGSQLPAPVKNHLQSHLKRQVVRFAITPPWGCTSSNPFEKALNQLACELANRASEARGKPTSVKNFIERGSRKRHPLSDRIEEALTRALGRTGRLHVVNTPRIRGIDQESIAAAVISGQYWADKGGVRVQADLKYKDKHSGDLFQDWDAEAFLPRESLTKEEFQSLIQTDSSQAFQTSPPLPLQTQQGTHDAWVQEFWNRHNPNPPFKTELKSERLEYVEGEEAVFRFRTERDCYLWVVSIGASGNGVVLFPNHVEPNIQNTFIRARDGWIQIPAEDWGFTYGILKPFGSERVKTICTTEPVQVIPQSTYRSQLYQFTPRNDGFRNFVWEEKSGNGGFFEWSEAQISVKTKMREEKG